MRCATKDPEGSDLLTWHGMGYKQKQQPELSIAIACTCSISQRQVSSKQGRIIYLLVLRVNNH